MDSTYPAEGISTNLVSPIVLKYGAPILLIVFDNFIIWVALNWKPLKSKKEIGFKGWVIDLDTSLLVMEINNFN